MAEQQIQQTDWYDNKQLYEMQVALSRKMEALSKELEKTQTMIKDYNGLRKKINDCELKITGICARGQGKSAMWGYIVGGLGILFAILSYVMN